MKRPLDQLRQALDPRSIALIGASENPNKVGGRPLLYLRRFGYRGRIYPINPNRADCVYPNPNLCGAGVAFKLAHAILADGVRNVVAGASDANTSGPQRVCATCGRSSAGEGKSRASSNPGIEWKRPSRWKRRP